jgi:hypothetical protein
LSKFIWILMILAIGIVLASLIYTLTIARAQKAVKGEYDSPINENVQSHPYLRNPIFLSIIFFMVFVIIYVLYLSYQ